MPNHRPNSKIDIYGNQSTFNLPDAVIKNVKNSPYFSQLASVKTVEELIDEIYEKVEYVEPWVAGKGLGTPSSAFCLLYKLCTLRPTERQISLMMEHPDSPYIRAIAFLFLRFVLDPRLLWEYFEPYVDDDEVFRPTAGQSSKSITMGKYVRDLLEHIKYHDIVIPRIPTLTLKDIQQQLGKRPLEKRSYTEKKSQRDERRESKDDIDSPRQSQRSRQKDRKRYREDDYYSRNDRHRDGGYNPRYDRHREDDYSSRNKNEKYRNDDYSYRNERHISRTEYHTRNSRSNRSRSPRRSPPWKSNRARQNSLSRSPPRHKRSNYRGDYSPDDRKRRSPSPRHSSTYRRSHSTRRETDEKYDQEHPSSSQGRGVPLRRSDGESSPCSKYNEEERKISSDREAAGEHPSTKIDNRPSLQELQEKYGGSNHDLDDERDYTKGIVDDEVVLSYRIPDPVRKHNQR